MFSQALEKVKSNPVIAVEGCHYEIARERRHQDVINFIRDHFSPDEPISKCIADILPWTEDTEAMWMSSVSLWCIPAAA